ncbi:hypothetical protein HDU86_004664 [Geranomyces michiganensis]|nr:hypothetical protein HDU86_004664 [Geranomyces michiganensis]
MHARAVDTVRRACRMQYVDTVARILQDSQASEKHRDGSLVAIFREHELRISEMSALVFSLKREARQRADKISRLRSKVARGQMILKKHGIFTEGEINLCIADERLRGDDSLERLRFQVGQKEEKLAELAEQKAQLEMTIKKRLADRIDAAEARLAIERQQEQQHQRQQQQEQQQQPQQKQKHGDRGTPLRRASLRYSHVSAVPPIPEAAETIIQSDSVASNHVENLLDTMLADTTSTYEAQLIKMRNSHAMRMAAMASDEEQTIRDLKIQYICAQTKITNDDRTRAQIKASMEEEGSIRDVVRQLFPRGQKSGFVDRGTQCSLDRL